MNHRVEGRKLIDGNFISPEKTIAVFSPEYNNGYQQRLVSTMNHGHEMLMAYMRQRYDLGIANIADFIQELEKVYSEWDADMYHFNRKHIYDNNTIPYADWEVDDSVWVRNNGDHSWIPVISQESMKMVDRLFGGMDTPVSLSRQTPVFAIFLMMKPNLLAVSPL